MAMIPIKVSRDREILVSCRGVGYISYHGIYIINILWGEPGRVQISDDGRRIDEVAIVKVVVVVKCVAKVGAVVTCLI